MEIRNKMSHMWPEDQIGSLNIKKVQRIEDLYSNTAIALRRLPYVEIIADRFVRKLAGSLRRLSNDFAVVAVDSVSSIRLDEIMPSIPSSSLIGIFRLNNQGGLGMMCLDQSLVHLFVDMMLGGKNASDRSADENRGYTSIGRSLIERVFKVMFADFGDVYESDRVIEFIFERLEVSARFVILDKPTSSVFHIRSKVELDDRNGFFDVVIPSSIVEYICSMNPDQEIRQDPLWEETLLDGIQSVHFALEVVLDEQIKSLSDVMSWKKGVEIPLLKGPDSLLSVMCEGKPMFMAKVGHKGPKVAMSIEEIIE